MISAGSEVVSRDTDAVVVDFQATVDATTGEVPTNEPENKSLLVAAEKGNTALVVKLLEAGADVRHSDGSGWSALLHAAEAGHAETVAALLGAGAHVRHAARDGDTALILAAWEGHDDVVRRLIAAGADVNHADATGWTALMRAAESGMTETTRLLLDAGADTHRADDDGWTALTNAAWRGRTETVAMLISAGADVHYSGPDKMTAFQWAANYGHKEIVTLLIDAGAADRAADFNFAYDKAVDNAHKRALNKHFRLTAGVLLSHHILQGLPAACFVESDDCRMTASGEGVRSVRTLMNLWKLPCLGKLKHRTECDEVKAAVMELIQSLCAEMRTLDRNLDCEPILVGSTANGTKAGLPDEFDFIFEIKKLYGKVRVERTKSSGAVQVYKRWLMCMKDYISVEMKETFVKILCKAMSNVMSTLGTSLKICKNVQICEWNKVCTTFNFMFTQGIFYKNLMLSIDVTPAIRIQGLPHNVQPKFPKNFHYHVVPKPMSASNKHWFVCTAQAENNYILGLPKIFKQAVVAAKAWLNPITQDCDLRYQDVVGNEHLKEDTDVLNLNAYNIDAVRLFIATRRQPKSLIDSYLLKLSVIHVSSCVSLDAQQSEEEQLHAIMREMFAYVKTCVTERNMPHPFIREFNVLAEDAGKLVEQVPALYLKRRCLEELLSRLDSGQLVSPAGLLQLSADELWAEMEATVTAEHPRIDPDQLSRNVRSWFARVWNELCN
ncbi:PREDICTED: uncharacterized protein LOC106810026 [Priapulus caudatus]|uniref:Uncharacterized protein LOC106810026 n=1 Tax=Priapulus caudatus TaxID=37621 RepID=A0ABM1E990_PRICU|nr:PREDICTED: uncharacterized protein LOC106810026 [Priapulus caudatus]